MDSVNKKEDAFAARAWTAQNAAKYQTRILLILL